MNVAVVGASDSPEKYSYRAVKLLQENGHTVFPVHRSLTRIDDTVVYASLKQLPQSAHTITLYVSAGISSGLQEEIIAAHPKRVIFNPGAENPELFERCRKEGIEAVNACTLVLLKTNQFGQ